MRTVDKIKQMTRQEAKRKGHVLGSFLAADDHETASSTCKRCHTVITIPLRNPPEQIHIVIPPRCYRPLP